LNDILCMWSSANVGTCLRMARILKSLPSDRKWSGGGRRWTLVDGADEISITKVKEDMILSIASSEDHALNVKFPILPGTDMRNPDEQIRIIADMLAGTTAWSDAEPDMSLQERSNEVSDVLVIAGGAIAREMEISDVTFCPPNPWNDGFMSLAANRLPIPERWAKTIGSILPRTYGCANDTVIGFRDLITLGPHWQMCARREDALGEMRLHAQAMKKPSA
jgi:hypothetical protein